MTEDTSPKNLRKFLESDDPAMVMIGLSMAKGTKVSDDMLALICGLYMWHDETKVRSAAKSNFMKHAPDDVKAIIKEKWLPKYRTLPRPIFRTKNPKGQPHYLMVDTLKELFEVTRNSSLESIFLWTPAITSKDVSWPVKKGIRNAILTIDCLSASDFYLNLLGHENNKARYIAVEDLSVIAIPSLLGFRLSSFWFSGASQPHYLDHGFDDYLDGKSLEKLNETKANNIIDLITKVFEKGDKQSHFDRGNPDYFPIDNEVLNALRKLGHEVE